jgi:N-acetylglucosaminyldiphosphoundecaprenol N-acetyl-beta-D-mannosaminyltransferase
LGWIPCVRIFGTEIHNIDLAQAVDLISRAIERGDRGYVVTPNVHHIVLLRHHPVFRAAYDGAALRLPDGTPLVWASRLLGRPLHGRVAGADLLPALCRAAASRGFSVFFAGGRAGVARQAAERLARRLPGLRVAGTFTPADDFAGNAKAAEEMVIAVNQARPDLLFVGLGAPAQEVWVSRHWSRLKVPVAVCCGAALDFAAGTGRRAPAWVQGAGLEWLWRLVNEPRRLWRRYLVQDTAFLGMCIMELRTMRRAMLRKSGT